MRKLSVIFIIIIFSVIYLAYNKKVDKKNNIIVATTKQQVVNTKDSFGILYLYESKVGGNSWQSIWGNNTQTRTIRSGQNDPFDSFLTSRGNGNTTIDGNGVAFIAGESPRMYVYDKDNRIKWGDVEITVYMKRSEEFQKVSSQGLVIGARSEHQRVGNENPCFGQTYYARVLYDGRYNFQKELIHEKAYSVNVPSEIPPNIWKDYGNSFPKGQWIGVKFVIYNTGSNAVKLELYLDTTDGEDGGLWNKLIEYSDIGNWPLATSAKYDSKLCGYESSKVFSDAATSIFIRNDQVKQAYYKNFSIREIIPTLVQK